MNRSPRAIFFFFLTITNDYDRDARRVQKHESTFLSSFSMTITNSFCKETEATSNRKSISRDRFLRSKRKFSQCSIHVASGWFRALIRSTVRQNRDRKVLLSPSVPFVAASALAKPCQPCLTHSLCKSSSLSLYLTVELSRTG